MGWIIITLFSLFIGTLIGAFLMYRRDQSFLKNYKTLYNELQNNKIKLNEYQQRLNNHFTDNIELLNKISKNYKNLYQNMVKNADFFIPNIHHESNLSNFHIKNISKTHEEQLPIETPRDYCENTTDCKEKNHDI